jgi:hypothetical protein
LARLWRPGGTTKTALARELINPVATARRDRLIHVIADRAYICKARMPAHGRRPIGAWPPVSGAAGSGRACRPAQSGPSPAGDGLKT